MGQHWFRQWLVAWQHQAITYTNSNLHLPESCAIHIKAIHSTRNVQESNHQNIFERYTRKIKAPGDSELISKYSIEPLSEKSSS